MPKQAFLLLCCFLYCAAASGQTIHGEVVDMDQKSPIANVTIENIHTSLAVTSGGTGTFIIAAASGQLLEFKKQGYKTVHVRIPKGYVPSYFKIMMKQGMSERRDMYVANSTRYDYTSDSIRYHEIYKHALEFPKMSTFDMLASPFSALSGKNREIWKFQDDYEEFEKEKYVDKTFNAELITKFTGLKGDSLTYFMKRYRPSYEQLRNMNEYAFFNFIKGGVQHFRTRATPRGSQ